MSRTTVALAPCLRSKTAKARLFSLKLLDSVATYAVVLEWNDVCVATRRLLDDSNSEISGAAAHLLSTLGCHGHPKGMTTAEAEALVKDPTRSKEVKVGARARLRVEETRKRKRDESQKVERPSAPAK